MSGKEREKTTPTFEEMNGYVQRRCRNRGSDCYSCSVDGICREIQGNYLDHPAELIRAYTILKAEESDKCDETPIAEQTPAEKENGSNRVIEGERAHGAELHEAICAELTEIYRRKNADYGDSFHISFAEEGMAMPRIRLGDKLNRFKTLTRGEDAKVKDESIRDTLLDLANYAILTVMEMDDEG